MDLFVRVYDFLQARTDIDNKRRYALLSLARQRLDQPNGTIHLPGRKSAERLGIPTRSFWRYSGSFPADLLAVKHNPGCKGNGYYLPFLEAMMPNGTIPVESIQCGTIPNGTILPDWHHSESPPPPPEIPPIESVMPESCQSGTIRAALDIESTVVEVSSSIDRLAQKDPGKAECEQIGNGLYGFSPELGTIKGRPDADIVRQFVAVCPDTQSAVNLLVSLHRERVHRPRNYAWFVTVALDRFHHVKYKDFLPRWLHFKRKPPASATVSGVVFREDVLTNLQRVGVWR